jgi:hypothetical protein
MASYRNKDKAEARRQAKALVAGKQRHRQNRDVDQWHILLMPRVAETIGIDPGFDPKDPDSYLPLFDRIRRGGASVSLKVDGERRPGDAGSFTAVVVGGKLGKDEAAHTDSDDFCAAAAYVIVEYARACWGFKP